MNDMKIGEFQLVDFTISGQRFLYLYDYGDEWTFIVEMDIIHETDSESFQSFVKDSKGKAPDQYGKINNLHKPNFYMGIRLFLYSWFFHQKPPIQGKASTNIGAVKDTMKQLCGTIVKQENSGRDTGTVHMGRDRELRRCRWACKVIGLSCEAPLHFVG